MYLELRYSFIPYVQIHGSSNLRNMYGHTEVAKLDAEVLRREAK